MVYSGYARRRIPERRPRAKGLSVAKKQNNVSLKNQIRSAERMLRRNIHPEVREVHEKKLAELKNKQELHTRLQLERKIFLRDRKIKFFERRKLERRIRRLEKQNRVSFGQTQDPEIAEQLSGLKEDLEYVRFFPKTEKYVSLFVGSDDIHLTELRNRLREQIKANLIAAAASGKDLEETGSEEDGLLDLSEDDFFLGGSSSDKVDADDEWTDRSLREHASGISTDERNQRQNCARSLMPPPRPAAVRSGQALHRPARPLGMKTTARGLGTYSGQRKTSTNRSGSSTKSRDSSNPTGFHSSNLSSNSDARKPHRKRRPKKKKLQENFI